MATITEDYCSFEISKLLKDKEFDAECRAAYTNYGKLFTIQIQQYITNILCSKGILWDCVAPTHQMALKWLREVHNINICIFPCHYDYILWGYDCKIYKNKDLLLSLTKTTSYEEAVEIAIKFALENLI